MTSAGHLCILEDMRTLSIPKFPEYRVREDGQVETNWRLCYACPGMEIKDKWTILPPPISGGYIKIRLINKHGDIRRTHRHRLVLELFGPEKPPGKVCCRHLDGKPENNHISNLSWGTYAQNEDDKRLHGTWESRVTNAKLTDDKMATINQLRNKGLSMKLIAEAVGVTRPTISRFLGGKTWK